MNVTPRRLPDAASIRAVLDGLDPDSAGKDLIPALAAAFKAHRVGLPNPDTAVLLRWVERTYGF